MRLLGMLWLEYLKRPHAGLQDVIDPARISVSLATSRPAELLPRIRTSTSQLQLPLVERESLI
eukprot:scaffold585704_cov18-Prasinocladus_malaysianus.AAC.1